jgi:hypothetical protein
MYAEKLVSYPNDLTRNSQDGKDKIQLLLRMHKMMMKQTQQNDKKGTWLWSKEGSTIPSK